MAINSYSYAAAVRLSDNFCAAEFRCKCGKQHEILISTELVNGLQQLVKTLGASKAIITSGYRCPSHDKAVGGNGYGQHTKGTAADVIFCDRFGKPVSTKVIACRAQDLGFNGIANIDSTYTAIHLDVRTTGKWYGDEVVGTGSSVTADFYKYYGISRNNDDITKLQAVLNGYGHKLDTDGIAGVKTLAAVKKHTVDRGDSGELVRWVQTRLNNLGYDCGSTDGISGERTMSAVYAWQRDNSLGVGYLGGSDWDILLTK